MTFRRPDRAEPVVVCEFRTFQQQFIFAAPDAIVIAPIKQAKVHTARAGANRTVRNLSRALITRNHNLEAAREGVEELEHRDIKAKAGDCKPSARVFVLDLGIHASKEIHHIAVLDHDAFGATGGA